MQISGKYYCFFKIYFVYREFLADFQLEFSEIFFTFCQPGKSLIQIFLLTFFTLELDKAFFWCFPISDTFFLNCFLAKQKFSQGKLQAFFNKVFEIFCRPSKKRSARLERRPFQEGIKLDIYYVNYHRQ